MSIIAGIDEITSDIALQESIIKNYIETETEYGINQMNEDEIELSSKEFAEKELDKRIKQVEKENKDHRERAIETNNTITQQNKDIRSLKEKISQLENYVNSNVENNNSVEKELNKYKLKLWKIKKIVLWSMFLLLAMVVIFLSFFLEDWDYNFVRLLINYFDNLESETLKEIGKYLIVLPVILFGYSVLMIYDAITTKTFNKEKCKFLKRSHN